MRLIWPVRTAETATRLALVVALGLTACGGQPPKVTMDDGQEMGTVHGHWQFGRPMWMVMQVPSFNRDVRVTDLRFELASGQGAINATHKQLLVMSTGPYRGLTLSYRLDTQGGRLLPLDKLTIRAGDHPELALVALISSGTPGCHEARLVLKVKADGSQRFFRPRWYIGLDTGLSGGRGEHYCDPTSSPSQTPSHA